MTVIAWDGAVMAADRRAVDSGVELLVSKLRRFDGMLVGISGEAAHAEELFAWFAAGASPEAYPPAQREDATWCAVLAVRPDGTLLRYGLTPYPIQIANSFAAIGSGRDYALAAMHLGRGARQAVEVACALNTSCGGGIDHLFLGGKL